jgi:eukaryotic-like serine/threonine-protein kinase
VIHRDVKPENLFLVHAPDGRELVKLLDFGFASLEGPAEPAADDAVARPPSPTRPPASAKRSTVVGTPEYMAPEQAQGADPHPSADVYSLGIALYEMLAGRVPFVGDSYPAIAHQHFGQDPAPMRRYNPGLVVSAELEAAVGCALAKSPEARFGSMAALRLALLATPEAGGSGQ